MPWNSQTCLKRHRKASPISDLTSLNHTENRITHNINCNPHVLKLTEPHSTPLWRNAKQNNKKPLQIYKRQKSRNQLRKHTDHRQHIPTDVKKRLREHLSFRRLNALHQLQCGPEDGDSLLRHFPLEITPQQRHQTRMFTSTKAVSTTAIFGMKASVGRLNTNNSLCTRKIYQKTQQQSQRGARSESGAERRGEVDLGRVIFPESGMPRVHGFLRKDQQHK